MDETKIAVFTVVNTLGTIVDRNGNVVRCNRNFLGGDCLTASEMIRNVSVLQQLDSTRIEGPTNNTTLTLVVTNQKLPFWALQRLATQVNTSMGRAIHPFSTQYDGDVLYAVLNSVPQLPSKPSIIISEELPKSYQNYIGEYEFYGGGILQVDVDEIWSLG